MPDRTNTPTNFLLGEKIIHWAKQISELPISSGQWVLLEGASGSGKTSLLRALLEDVENGVLVPQTLQIPQGSLIEWLNPSRCLSQSELSHHLSAIGLHHLIPKLRVTACWGQILSGGEQQRLALLRAVLLKPSWLLLDEPLSMLDSTSTALVLQWLAKEGNARVLIATHKEIHKFSPEWALMFLDGGLHIRYQGSISAVMTGEAERSYPPGPVSKGSLRNIRQKQLPSENTLDCDSSALPTALQNHS